LDSALVQRGLSHDDEQNPKFCHLRYSLANWFC